MRQSKWLSIGLSILLLWYHIHVRDVYVLLCAVRYSRLLSCTASSMTTLKLKYSLVENWSYVGALYSTEEWSGNVQENISISCKRMITSRSIRYRYKVSIVNFDSLWFFYINAIIVINGATTPVWSRPTLVSNCRHPSFALRDVNPKISKNCLVSWPTALLHFSQSLSHLFFLP